MSEAEALEWVMERSRRWAAETGVDWAVVDRDRVIGRVGFKALDLPEAQAEAGYWVLPSTRGGGVAVRALRAASTWMFAQIGFHRLELTHSTDNEVSCRVAQSAGYRLEGTRRQQGLHADGWHDMHLHARLEDDPDTL